MHGSACPGRELGLLGVRGPLRGEAPVGKRQAEGPGSGVRGPGSGQAWPPCRASTAARVGRRDWAPRVICRWDVAGPAGPGDRAGPGVVPGAGAVAAADRGARSRPAAWAHRSAGSPVGAGDCGPGRHRHRLAFARWRALLRRSCGRSGSTRCWRSSTAARAGPAGSSSPGCCAWATPTRLPRKREVRRRHRPHQRPRPGARAAAGSGALAGRGPRGQRRRDQGVPDPDHQPGFGVLDRDRHRHRGRPAAAHPTPHSGVDPGLRPRPEARGTARRSPS